MPMTQIVKGVYALAMGKANAFLIEDSAGLILIDAGYPGKEDTVFAAVRKLGCSPPDLKHLILTHAHPDHIGSAAAIVAATKARTYLHTADIAIAQAGGPFRPMHPAPGLLRHILCKLVYKPQARVTPVSIDVRISDRDVLPLAGGLEVIYTPGHCQGHVALLMRKTQILFAGDACMNTVGLGDPVGFENVQMGRMSQQKLAGLSFGIATFGHGRHLSRNASQRIRERFVGESAREP